MLGGDRKDRIRRNAGDEGVGEAGEEHSGDDGQREDEGRSFAPVPHDGGDAVLEEDACYAGRQDRGYGEEIRK